MCWHRTTKIEKPRKKLFQDRRKQKCVNMFRHVRVATYMCCSAQQETHTHGYHENACHSTSMSALTGHQCISAYAHMYAAVLYACFAVSAQDCINTGTVAIGVSLQSGRAARPGSILFADVPVPLNERHTTCMQNTPVIAFSTLTCFLVVL